jgi:hypothetical protein
MVLAMCQLFHCTPSVLDEESAEIIRLVNIKALGTKEQKMPDIGEGV